MIHRQTHQLRRSLAVAAAAAAVSAAASQPAFANSRSDAKPTASADAERGTRSAAATSSRSSQSGARAKRVRSAKRRAASASGKASGRKLSTVSLADALAHAAAYTGPTGTVIYSRTVTVDLRSSTASRAEGERWTEIGGGRREHYVGRTVDAKSGSPLGKIEGWTSPKLGVVVSGSAAPVVGVRCVASAAPESNPLVRADRAALATLPVGPDIDGVATRVGVHTFGGASELRNYLDAQTGRPLRSTHGAPGAEPQLETTYLAWDERPAGGSAADLDPVIGADARLSPLTGPNGCIEQR